MVINSNYFYGNKVSDYGIKNGYVDYATLAKAFNAVLNNYILSATVEIYWEQISGFIDNSEEINELEEQITETDDSELIEQLEEKINELEEEQDNYPEVFQWYIVDDNGASLLEECNEIVYYNDELDMYVWGVTHYGTSWDYVLTDIKIEQ